MNHYISTRKENTITTKKNKKSEKDIPHYLPTVMAPTTKPCAATRMWIRWTDILVSPRLFIFISLYPTMAKNPAIPTKSRDYVNSKKGGCHFVLKCNGIISGSSKTRMHQGGGGCCKDYLPTGTNGFSFAFRSNFDSFSSMPDIFNKSKKKITVLFSYWFLCYWSRQLIHGFLCYIFPKK